MIVISNPIAIANEINTIHALFEEGMELFHVRKPNYSETEIKDFVATIGLEYSQKLVLHSHHHLAEDLGINRIHFTEKARTNPIRVSNPDRIISTSIHSINEFNSLSNHYEYAFLSPVFSSISKENYAPKTDLFEEIKKRTNFNTQLVALGGVSAANVKQTLEKGFDAIALLGTIWNSEKPIKNFILCQQIVHSF
ncbi:thiamine-phosphate pyrophosphorylase [Flavobacterium flevense]|uniref:Thiamine phosphate synthase n=1 Tax=Flavobacterium flevense TaxID=983 RepID=A0A4Y4AUA9_9FLAO|nr:thiamine phosphate synthase [Flavobacterium flevense]GEC71798.1 thiamine phosphate synthase [Flavobacterium flevense]SHL37635.1 thiamine-phosphate pyrophosphorylase [Flavobacterium flevense]